jgi:hypothetical protein
MAVGDDRNWFQRNQVEAPPGTLTAKFIVCIFPRHEVLFILFLTKNEFQVIVLCHLILSKLLPTYFSFAVLKRSIINCFEQNNHRKSVRFDWTNIILTLF